MRCKVIATCFTARETRIHAHFPYHRQQIGSPQQALAMLQTVLAADRGDAALLIVNNQTGFAAGDRFLDSLPCIVEHRENVGGPVAAFDHAFQRYRDRFDYWLFTEDDIVITTPYDLLQARFDALQPDCGFLAVAGFNDREPCHAHGAVGLTHRRVLERLCDSDGGHFPHPNGAAWNRRDMELDGEVAFSQAVLRLGFTIIPYGDNLRWAPENGCLPYYDFQLRPSAASAVKES